MAVPATTSRPRKPKTAASSCSGKTKAIRISATSFRRPVAASSSWRPLTRSVRAREGEEAERQRVADRAQHDPGCALHRATPRRAHGATTRACGAASFMPRLQPLELGRCLALARLDDVEQLVVAQALRRLADERPGHVAFARHQVEVVQVAQQAQAALAGAREELACTAGRARRGASSP